MNKTVLITGATAGIGREFSKIFAENHYNLVLVARDSTLLKQMSREWEKRYGVAVTAIAKDLSHSDAPRDLYQEIANQNIEIDVLVNNAGRGSHGAFLGIGDDDTASEVQLNIGTLTMLCKLFGNDMVKRGGGRILNVSSTAGFQAGPLMSVYYASKGYVLLFSEALNFELKKKGVAVTVLCPGPTKTEFFKRSDMTATNLAKGPWIMEASDVAQAGYSGLMNGKTIIIPGMLNKLMTFMVRFTPRRLAATIVYFLHQK